MTQGRLGEGVAFFESGIPIVAALRIAHWQLEQRPLPPERNSVPHASVA